MVKSFLSFVLSLLLLVALLLTYLVVALLPPSFGRRTGWVLVGEKRLGRAPGVDSDPAPDPTPDLAPDRAIVPLASPLGRPRSLQLRVLRAATRLRALTLRFADGRSQVLDLDETLAPGGATRIIDLPRRPAVQSVEVLYEAKPGPLRPVEESATPLVRVYGLS